MIMTFANNNSKRRRSRGRCDRQIYCSAALIISISTIKICNANFSCSNQNRHRYSPFRSPKLPTLTSIFVPFSTPNLLQSLRGGDSGKQQQQQPMQQRKQSLSKNNGNEKSPFEYIPITALNDYGQSTQLRHAMEAASRYGTPIIACLCCSNNDGEKSTSNDDDDDNLSGESSKNGKQDIMENSIIICSLQRPRLGIVAPSIPSGTSSIIKNRHLHNNKSIKFHPSIQGLVKIIATRDDVDDIDPCNYDNDGPIHTLQTAIVSTGIQSDAVFLLSQLQRHFSKFWFRYNTLPTSRLSVVKMIREVLLDFMGYDWSEEVGSSKISGGVGSAAPSYSENEDDNNGSPNTAGRPLGVSSFLLSMDNDDTTSLPAHRPTITAIEANGSSEQYVARAIGVGAQKANELLSQKWKRCMTCDEVKNMMQEILYEIAVEQGWLSLDDDRESSSSSSSSNANANVDGKNDEMHVGLTIAFETLTRTGIDIEFAPLNRRKSD